MASKYTDKLYDCNDGLYTDYQRNDELLRNMSYEEIEECYRTIIVKFNKETEMINCKDFPVKPSIKHCNAFCRLYARFINVSVIIDEKNNWSKIEL
jgi:hypothetical protein